MSNNVFPTLAGVEWPIQRKPTFNTSTKQAVSGRELRLTQQIYPLTEYQLSFEFLRSDSNVEYETLAGFFLSVRGASESWLFTDPADYSVTDMSFGTGDGATVSFQLSRSFGAGGFTFSQAVQNVNAATAIKVAGVTKTVTTDYTIDPTGLVTFTVAPAAAAALTWTGTYYHRCRFKDDGFDSSGFAQNMWEAKKLAFIGSLGNFL